MKFPVVRNHVMNNAAATFTLLFSISMLCGFAVGQESQPVATKSDRNALDRASRLMEKIDKDGNGTFKKSESVRLWNRYRKLDTNQDKVISVEELSKEKPAYLETGGERKLDVVYKRVGQRKPRRLLPRYSLPTQALPLCCVCAASNIACRLRRRHPRGRGSPEAPAGAGPWRAFCVDYVGDWFWVCLGRKPSGADPA